MCALRPCEHDQRHRESVDGAVLSRDGSGMDARRLRRSRRVVREGSARSNARNDPVVGLVDDLYAFRIALASLSEDRGPRSAGKLRLQVPAALAEVASV